MVADGYDAMIDTWEAWVAQVEDDPRQEWTADLVSRLPVGARVLELGCGGGTRETAFLAERFQLTGVDLSARQLERARGRIPGASFVQGDLTELGFDHASFDAVVAYDEVVTISEPEGGVQFQWVLAQR
jgi:ubiquinone/menaquinone biosynthesis C-methylase UbiE